MASVTTGHVPDLIRDLTTERPRVKPGAAKSNIDKEAR